MKRSSLTACAGALAALAVGMSAARADDPVCGTLESATGGQDAPITLREGESVNFWRSGAVRHGALHVYKEGEVYRVYWQPEGSGDLYVLANEGTNSVRLILTPTRGTKVDTGPGSLPPQKVLSCPAM
jgi:hypothetical protein